MRLNAIKQVCKAARQIRLLTADGDIRNMVTQWIGTDKALYPVRGLTLDLKVLSVIWELDPKKADYDMAEGEFADMVDRGLLADADAHLLRSVPASIDVEKAPRLGIGELNGYKALAVDDDKMLFLPSGSLEPCYKQGGWNFDIVRGDSRRVAVYGRDNLIAVLSPVTTPDVEGLAGILRCMAAREICC